MLNVPGYAINPSNTHFAPSVTVRSGTFVVRFVWHTPQVITVEKRSGIGWRHLFLIGDQEHSFNERDCKKLLRRLRLLDKVLSEAVEEAVHSPFYAAAIADSANRARQFGSAIGRKRRIMPL